MRFLCLLLATYVSGVASRRIRQTTGGSRAAEGAGSALSWKGSKATQVGPKTSQSDGYRRRSPTKRTRKKKPRDDGTGSSESLAGLQKQLKLAKAKVRELEADIKAHSAYEEYAIGQGITQHRAPKVECEACCPGNASLIAVEATSDTLDKLREFMKPKRADQLGVGRDVSDYAEYKDLSLVAAWKVANKEIDARYTEESEYLKKWLSPATRRIKTPSSNLGDIPGSDSLNKNINEAYFYHGTSPENLLKIACSGLKFGGGLFGPGIYLADVAEKFDQYTTHKGEQNGRALDAFVSNNSAYKAAHGDVFYGFIVRAALGNVFEGDCACTNCFPDGKFTSKQCRQCGRLAQGGSGDMIKTFNNTRFKAVSPDLKEDKWGKMRYAKDSDGTLRYDSIYARKKPGSCIQRFNEAIVPLDSGRVKVEYIVAYQRCKEAHGKCEPAR